MNYSSYNSRPHLTYEKPHRLLKGCNKGRAFRGISRVEIDFGRSMLLRPPTATRPAIWIVEKDGEEAVIKDYGANRPAYRNTVGRFLVRREVKALRKLEGIPGIPTHFGTIEGPAVIMERIKGKSVEGLEESRRLPPQFFLKLRDLVAAFHSRGVAHCDLKRAPNILVGPEGEPYVVDWSAAVARSELKPFPLSLIYKRFLEDDLNAVVKLQLRHYPEGVSVRELRRYHHRGPLERLVRRLRDHARDLLQRMA
ncbi:MAG: RIO1 family regulatory kinase/ATPase [Desulfobacteraceae bacterium]